MRLRDRLGVKMDAQTRGDRFPLLAIFQPGFDVPAPCLQRKGGGGMLMKWRKWTDDFSANSQNPAPLGCAWARRTHFSSSVIITGSGFGIEFCITEKRAVSPVEANVRDRGRC